MFRLSNCYYKGWFSVTTRLNRSFFTKSWKNVLPKLLLATAYAIGMAAHAVEVDDWTVGHEVTANLDFAATTKRGGGVGGSMLGGWRNVYVTQAIGASGVGTVASVSSAGVRNTEINSGSDNSALVRLFWDGSQRYTTPIPGVTFPDNVANDPILDYLDGSNNLVVVPSEQGPGSANGGSVDPEGLKVGGVGVDLTKECPGEETDGIYLLLGNPDLGSLDVTVSVFTDGSNWSSLTRTQSVAEIVQFAFDDFSDQGQNETQGADFSNVGAIVISSEANALAIDASFATPIASACGYDFGDAPDDDSEALQSYVTLAEADAQGRGPHHLIEGPFLGSGTANDTDSEVNGQETVGANGDDNDFLPDGTTPGDDEEAVTFPVEFFSSFAFDDGDVDAVDAVCSGQTMDRDVFCASVEVNNSTAEWAQVVGWIDFNGNGVFDNNCGTGSDGAVSYVASSECERSSSTIIVGSGGLGDITASSCSSTQLAGATVDNLGDFTGGNVPAGCEGTVVLTWDLANVLEDLTENDTYARVRISTDNFDAVDSSGFFATDGPRPVNFADDGEVEDHILSGGTVPVGIHAFESRTVKGGVEVSWSTVSENENVGFFLWGDNGRQYELLTPDMVPAKVGDLMTSRSYSVNLPSDAMRDVNSLIITAVDHFGKEEMYGMFSVGGAYGRDAHAAPIDWAGIRQEAQQNLARHGLSLDGQLVQRSANFGVSDAVDFRVESAGMQRITYDQLVAAGLDLQGVSPDDIAVTLNGVPVSRKVHSTVKKPQAERLNRRGVNGGSSTSSVPNVIDSTFAVDFWGEAPQGSDALYVDKYVYRVSVDRSLARNVVAYSGRPLMQEASFHWRTISVEEDNRYSMWSVLEDPWYMSMLRANHSTERFATTIDLPADRLPNQPAWLEARVAGVGDFPESPDHQVDLYFNGEMVDTVQFDGQTERLLRVKIPASDLTSGRQSVEVHLPGGTDAPFDLVYLDEISLTYAASLNASSGRVLIESIDPNRAFSVSNLDANSAMAFAWDGSRLVELPVERATAGRVAVSPEIDSQSAIWVSESDALYLPTAVGGYSETAPAIDRSTDLVVIAHPAFMPVDAYERHPLNDYITHRQAQGWDVSLVDLTQLQARYTNGMALPKAVSAFLADATRTSEFEHVLLVGGDSYDYFDRLGTGGLSFIPTVYGDTSFVYHVPSDALMSDINGDGLSDKAIGRWPVRSIGDLSSIVQKTLDWDSNMRSQQTAVWAVDTEDPNLPSFTRQADRMLSPLRVANWSESGFDTVEIGADHFASAEDARIQFFKLLQEGKALTGYTGHGSAGVWSYQGFLFPSDLADLYNDGFPTLIGTMACYTSYFSSPSNDTVAHRWMNGFRLDSNGDPIPGAPNGAVAVHGAATLSNYAQNESFASTVVTRQIEGDTLGQAVLAARAEAQRRGTADLVVNWTLLGDPTIRLQDSTDTRPRKGAE